MTKVDGQVDSDQILRELIQLRGYEGLTLRKLRDKSPGMLTLRCIHDEAARRGIATSDRYLAANSVIRCAIENLVSRTDHSIILLGTLNMPGRSVMHGLLEYRQDLLRAELNLTEKTFRLAQRDAYIDLAGRLVLAETSPCQMEILPDKTLRLDISIEGSAEELAAAFNLLTFEVRPAIRARLAEEILRVLPQAAMIVTDGQARGLPELVYLVIVEVYPSEDESGTKYYSAEKLATTLGVVGGELSSFPEDFHLQRQWAGRPYDVEQHLRSLVRLADLILKIEHAHAWPDLVHGAAIDVIDLAPVEGT